MSFALYRRDSVISTLGQLQKIVTMVMVKLSSAKVRVANTHRLKKTLQATVWYFLKDMYVVTSEPFIALAPGHNP